MSRMMAYGWITGSLEIDWFPPPSLRETSDTASNPLGQVKQVWHQDIRFSKKHRDAFLGPTTFLELRLGNHRSFVEARCQDLLGKSGATPKANRLRLLP